MIAVDSVANIDTRVLFIYSDLESHYIVDKQWLS